MFRIFSVFSDLVVVGYRDVESSSLTALLADLRLNSSSLLVGPQLVTLEVLDRLVLVTVRTQQLDVAWVI